MKWICEQDEEDYEQDKAIKDWIENNPQGRDVDFEYKFINSKGKTRNTLVRAALSLDQQIQSDTTGTFADLIKGSDGRDLYCGEMPGADAFINAYLSALGLGEGLKEWVIKTLKLSVLESNWLSKKSQIDLELSILLEPFSE